MLPHTARKARSATYFRAVTARRDTLALYLAWEYGMRRANEILRDMPKGFREIGYFRTKREAEDFAGRIREVANWQRGKLGHPMNDGGVFVL